MNTAVPMVDEQRIRETAYLLWEEDGRPIGQAHKHWELAKKIAEDTARTIAAPRAEAAPKKKRAAAKTARRIQ